MRLDLLKRGVNLGGWISQYGEIDPHHFDAFITREDIRQISDWGFDHVRLPVDYDVLEDKNIPGKYLERGFDHINDCLAWCADSGLRVILDLHKAPGYAFDEQGQNDFETNPARQEHFIALWRALTQRFAAVDQDLLAFELLNEVVFEDATKWNAIVEKTIKAIRSIDQDRLILFGGNYYSSVDTLSELPQFADENVQSKFHFYLPLSVTHQKAYWVPPLLELDQTVDYPGRADGLEAYLSAHPEYGWRLADEIGVEFNEAYLRKLLAPAVEFMRERHTGLHCGEFGVIDRAPMQTRLNWTRDLVKILKNLGIGYAYWTYKAMDFGLVDARGNVIHRELINILTG
jgi:aryl-phospho-beta-D-glucosidase BglC (GH1 family)